MLVVGPLEQWLAGRAYTSIMSWPTTIWRLKYFAASA